MEPHTGLVTSKSYRRRNPEGGAWGVSWVLRAEVCGQWCGRGGAMAQRPKEVKEKQKGRQQERRSGIRGREQTKEKDKQKTIEDKRCWV